MTTKLQQNLSDKVFNALEFTYILCMITYYILFTLNLIFPISTLLYQGFSSLIFVVFLISAISINKGSMRYLAVFFLIVAHVILLNLNLSFDVWYTYMQNGFNVMLIFVAVPIFSIPLHYGHYFESVRSFASSKQEKPGALFVFLVLLYLLLAIPLNIGSIPTMQKLLDDLHLPKKYLSSIYTAGYSSYMVFSPFDGMVNLALVWTAISYRQYFFKAIVMVIAIICVTSFLLWWDQKNVKSTFISDKDNLKISNTQLLPKDIKKIVELVIHIGTLICLVFIGQYFYHEINQLYVVSIIIILYSILWSFYLYVTNTLIISRRKECHKYYKGLLSFKNFTPFLVAANFLGAIVSLTLVKDIIGQLTTSLIDIPLYFILMGLILLTTCLSLLGVHMLITVTIFAFTIDYGSLGLQPASFAITLLCCWFVAMSFSPLVPFANVVSDTINENVTKITFSYNLRFVILMLFIAPALIILMN